MNDVLSTKEVPAKQVYSDPKGAYIHMVTEALTLKGFKVGTPTDRNQDAVVIPMEKDGNEGVVVASGDEVRRNAEQQQMIDLVSHRVKVAIEHLPTT